VTPGTKASTVPLLQGNQKMGRMADRGILAKDKATNFGFNLPLPPTPKKTRLKKYIGD